MPAIKFYLSAFQVFVIDIKGASILYQKQFPTQIYTGTISLLFENCNHNGYLKNVLLIATEESSIIAVEEDTGNDLNSNGLHTKKPYRCLMMQILGESFLVSFNCSIPSFLNKRKCLLFYRKIVCVRERVIEKGRKERVHIHNLMLST